MRPIAWIVALGIAAYAIGTAAAGAAAAPCYGTRMPGKHRLVAGLETYIIADRDLEGTFGEVRSSQQFLTMSFGIFDWLSIDLKGGAGNIKHHPQGSDEIDYDTGFAGGYGYRIKVLDSEKCDAVFGFQHISVHPRTERTGAGGDVSNKAVLDDWQYSLLVSYAAGRWTPYLGTRWSRTDLIHRVEGDRKRKMSDGTESVGLIAGVDVSLASSVWLNAEVQALDAEAASLSINWAF